MNRETEHIKIITSALVKWKDEESQEIVHVFGNP